MAEVRIGIGVDGAEASVEKIDSVSIALKGVNTSLDATTAATGDLSGASNTLSNTEKDTGASLADTSTAARDQRNAIVDAALGARGAVAPYGDLRGELGNSATATRGLSVAQQNQAEQTAVNRAKSIDWDASLKELDTSTDALAQLLIGGFSVGLLAAAAAIGAWLVVGRQMLGNLQETERALSTLDFGAVTKQLQSAEGALTDYDTAWKAVSDDTTSYGVTMASIFTVAWTNLKTVTTEFMFAQASLNKEVARSAEAVERLYPATEALKLSLAATTATLTAQNAELGRLSALTTNVDDLTASYAKQADNIKAMADARANQMIIDALAVDKQLRAANDVAGADARMGLIAQQANALRAQAATDAANVILKGAEDVAAVHAREIATLGTLRVLHVDTALAAAAANEQQITTLRATADAMATFYGQARQNVAGYYEGVQQRITETAALEIEEIQTRADADIAGLRVRRDAWPEHSKAWEQLNDQITIKDAETQAALAKQGTETTTKRIQAYAAELAAMQAAYAEKIAKTETYYGTLDNLGQGSIAKHLEFLRAQADNENLSFADRQKYAVAAYQGYQRLDQELFDMRKALGQTTQLDEVRRLADLVSQTAAGSEARIQAETTWANAATRLRDDASSAALRGMNAIADQLKAEGYENITLNDIYANGARIRAQMLGETNQGLGLTFDRFKDIQGAAGAFNSLSAVGIDLQTGMGTALGLVRDQLQGVRGPLGEAGTQFGTLGTAALGLDPQLDAISADFADMGNKMSTSLTEAYTTGIAATKKFFEDLDQEIQTGASRTADRLYQGLINRIKGALDAEAFAS